VNFIEMVPSIKNFDRIKDRETVETLTKRYGAKRHPNRLALLHFNSTTILSFCVLKKIDYLKPFTLINANCSLFH